MEYIIENENAGKSVKEYVFGTLRISSKLLTRLKQNEHGILLNGERVTVRARLGEGDRLSLATEEEAPNDTLVPTDLPLDILYEDEYVIALNKPPYMPTHPSHGHFADTLANGLCFYMKKKSISFVFRAVNRLDRNTSGIVLVAKNADAAFRFSSMVAQGKISKTYFALVSGITQESGTVEGYIRRTADSIITRELLPTLCSGGAYSRTNYQTLQKGNDCSLLRLSPQTGRTHQLRVHLSSIGHPIIGDDLYGGSDSENRHMLHAVSLSFLHPYNGTPVTLTAPIPADFSKAAIKRGISL